MRGRAFGDFSPPLLAPAFPRSVFQTPRPPTSSPRPPMAFFLFLRITGSLYAPTQASNSPPPPSPYPVFGPPRPVFLSLAVCFAQAPPPPFRIFDPFVPSFCFFPIVNALLLLKSFQPNAEIVCFPCHLDPPLSKCTKLLAQFAEHPEKPVSPPRTPSGPCDPRPWPFFFDAPSRRLIDRTVNFPRRPVKFWFLLGLFWALFLNQSSGETTYMCGPFLGVSAVFLFVSLRFSFFFCAGF